MSKVVESYIKSAGYLSENVSLKKYELSDGTHHWLFRDRHGRPSNPTDAEAEMIIKNWNLTKK